MKTTSLVQSFRLQIPVTNLFFQPVNVWNVVTLLFRCSLVFTSKQELHWIFFKTKENSANIWQHVKWSTCTFWYSVVFREVLIMLWMLKLQSAIYWHLLIGFYSQLILVFLPVPIQVHYPSFSVSPLFIPAVNMPGVHVYLLWRGL